LLIAGGVGITPLLSVLFAAADAGHVCRIRLRASYRTEAEVMFREEIAALGERLPGREVSTVVTATRGRVDLDTS